jgi:hypothetical protein
MAPAIRVEVHLPEDALGRHRAMAPAIRWAGCNNHHMPRFKRLTIEEARTLNREQLLDRIEIEQKYWYRLIERSQIRPGDDEAYKVFTQIMHAAIDPGRAASDTLALIEGEPVNKDYWTKPLGELGDL